MSTMQAPFRIQIAGRHCYTPETKSFSRDIWPKRDAVKLRVPNIMNRVLRWHDFGSGREARRSEYREYSQGVRQSHGPKLVPARRVAAKTGTDFVGRLDHIRDMACVILRVIANFGSQRTRGS